MLKRIMVFILILAVTMPCVLFTAYGEEKRPKAAEFPDKTIIVGTYAVYLDCLTQVILDKAEASAASADQRLVFFKSDINKGVWYDITNGSDITDISINEENVVSNDTIDALPLTHYTKPTGETIEFATGQVVSASDIDSMEWPENMPELDGILDELDLQKNLKDNSKGDREDLYGAHVKSLNKLLARIETDPVKKLHDDALKLDQQIVQMQRDNKTPQQISLAAESLSAVIAEKDAHCYNEEIARFEAEIAALDYIDSATLIDKYNEWLTNLKAVQPAADELIDGGGEDGGGQQGQTDSSLNEMYDQAQKEFKDAVINGNSDEAQKALDQLSAIDSLINNDENVSDEIKEKQAEILDKAKDDAITNLLDGTADPSLAADEINTYDDGLIDRLDNLDAILEELNKSKQVFEQAGLDDAADAVEDKIDEQILNADPEYNQSLDRETEAEDEMNKTYQQYLNAIENRDTDKAADLKEQLDEAINKWQEAKKATDDARDKALGEDEAAPTPEDGKAFADKAAAAAEEAKKAAENAIKAAEEKLKEAAEQLADEAAQKAAEAAKKAAETAKKAADSAEEAKNKAAEAAEKGDTDGASRAADEAEAYANIADSAAEAAANGDAGAAEAAETANEETKAQQEAADAAASEAQAAAEAEAAASAQQSAMNAMVDSLNKAYAPYTFKSSSFLIFENYTVSLKRPIMYSGKNIYVDARDLAAQMGANVALSKTNKAVVIRAKGALIEYILGDKTIFVNDKKTSASPAPLLINGYEYIPLTSFENAFNLSERAEGEYVYVYK